MGCHFLPKRSSKPRDWTQVSLSLIYHLSHQGRALGRHKTLVLKYASGNVSPFSLSWNDIKAWADISPKQSLGGPRKQTRAIFWCGDPTSCYFSENQVLPFSSNLYAYDVLWSQGAHYCSVTQSCPTLFDSMNCSPPGSSVHWIFQARILEWVTISFSRGSSWLKDQTHVSCIGRRVLYHWATRKVCSLIGF